MAKQNIRSWELSGVTLTHFDDGCTRPYPILKTVNRWLKDTNIAPNHIRIETVYNTESERWEYVGTVEWDSKFVV